MKLSSIKILKLYKIKLEKLTSFLIRFIVTLAFLTYEAFLESSFK